MEPECGTFVGRIVELDWDDDGDVTVLGLETERDTYEIADTGRAAPLSVCVGRRVALTGLLSDDSPDAPSLLTVQAYDLLDPGFNLFGDEEDDEDEEDDFDDLEEVGRRRGGERQMRNARRESDEDG